jgi:hypothetical protein
MSQIPYSAVAQKLRSAYEDFFVEDLVLAVGGQALSPNDIEFEVFLAYGQQPVFKTWAGQPAIVLGVLIIMSFVCYCSYGSWGRDRDLQTGYTHADASQDVLVSTARELHEIKLGKNNPAHHNMLSKNKGLESHQTNKAAEGLHFVWMWPCSCFVYKN